MEKALLPHLNLRVFARCAAIHDAAPGVNMDSLASAKAKHAKFAPPPARSNEPLITLDANGEIGIKNGSDDDEHKGYEDGAAAAEAVAARRSREIAMATDAMIERAYRPLQGGNLHEYAAFDALVFPSNGLLRHAAASAGRAD